MTRDELVIARLMFVGRVLRANGMAFQHLFWSIMHCKHGQDFVAVRPQGRRGDGGNDGYLPAKGHYFQIYGPIDPSEKVTEAEAKLADDFENVSRNWTQVTPMVRYSFVFNDKYEGTFTGIAAALGKLEKTYPAVACRPFTAADLEDEFMSLPATSMQKVLDAVIPNPERIVSLDYRVLRDVITYVMASPRAPEGSRFGDLPTIDEKVRLNLLCSAWASMLRTGARHVGHIDAYFSKNSAFSKQELRDHVVGAYEAARSSAKSAALPVGVSRQDLTFGYFFEALLPTGATVGQESAVNALMSYYFEACDVFDAPGSKAVNIVAAG